MYVTQGTILTEAPRRIGTPGMAPRVTFQVYTRKKVDIIKWISQTHSGTGKGRNATSILVLGTPSELFKLLEIGIPGSQDSSWVSHFCTCTCTLQCIYCRYYRIVRCRLISKAMLDAMAWHIMMTSPLSFMFFFKSVLAFNPRPWWGPDGLL